MQASQRPLSQPTGRIDPPPQALSWTSFLSEPMGATVHRYGYPQGLPGAWIQRWHQAARGLCKTPIPTQAAPLQALLGIARDRPAQHGVPSNPMVGNLPCAAFWIKQLPEVGVTRETTGDPKPQTRV
jgi:hypothetical protein